VNHQAGQPVVLVHGLIKKPAGPTANTVIVSVTGMAEISVRLNLPRQSPPATITRKK